MTVLEAHDVTKIYREGRHEVPALRGVSLTVARGEIVAVEGPSGSGKTTLLCVLGCLLTPTGGRVIIDGREVDPQRPEELRRAPPALDRLRLPAIQPVRGADGLGECPVRPEPQGLDRAEGPARGRSGARRGRPGRSQGLPAPRPLGRPAAAGRRGTGAGRPGERDPRRRADRQPRLREREARARSRSATWPGPRAGRW